MAWTEVHLHAQCHLDPFSRLATIDMSQKLAGGSTPFWGGELVPHLTQSRLGRGLPPYLPSGILFHAAICPQQIWAENLGLCPFGGGGAGSPCNTVWLGPRPTCMPSFILIHPTIWPQYTNVTERTDRQDNGPIA